MLFLLLLLANSQIAKTKVIEGVLTTPVDQNWRFLTRFCFLSQYSALYYELSYPREYAVQNLYLYYDSSNQWPAIYKKGKTCKQKESVLRVEHNQVINLTAVSPINSIDEPNCVEIMREGRKWLNCVGTRKFISARERWWYIAVGNCNTSKGLYLEYKMRMTNYEPENIWFYHFSADEHYILPTDIGFLFIETLALVLAILVALLLRARQMFHSTYKLFLVSLFLECSSLICDCVAGGQYSRDGIGLRWLKLTGQLLRAASTLTFILLLILIGKGYTITRGRLSSKGAWKILFFMCTYMLMYLTVYVWQIRGFDPGKVLYLYESPPGYGIIALRLFGWIWFCYAIYFTLVHYPEKRHFYYPFSAIISIWFWLGPIVILVANHILDNWIREKVSNGIESAVAFFGFLAFLFITRPSAANSNFPYHVRTTQISALNASQPDSARSTNLPHNAYEVRYAVFTVGGQQKPDVFMTKRNISEGHESDEPLESDKHEPEPPPSYDQVCLNA